MEPSEQDIADVKRIFLATRKSMKPQLDAARERAIRNCPPGKVPVFGDPNVMYMQNAMRFCMEVMLNECLPYNQMFLAELGTRLAAYAISAAPVADHPGMVEFVQNALPGMVDRKVAEGAIIKTDWVTNGVEHPNVPNLPGLGGR